MRLLQHFRSIAGIPGLLAIGFSLMVSAAEEDAVKASYLYNFTKFVEWPATDATGSSSFDLCILGDENFTALAMSLAGKEVRQQPIKVVNAKRLASPGTCRLLYIDASEKWRIGTVLQEVSGKPVLTVSDTKGFAEQGGMIELVRSEERLRFSINLKAAQVAGLQISAQIAKLAVKVY